MGLFITFEGGEGCGKSTQAKLLYRRLHKLSLASILIHEPGITALGKRIARLLKWSQDIDISPISELLLFNVSRAQLVRDVIRPNLEKEIIVLCDRYADSTTAYQGYGRQLDLSLVKAVNDIAIQGVLPNLTILLDIPVEKGMERKKGEKPDRLEKESLGFHRRVREGYLKMSSAEPERWLLVDSTKSKEDIAAIIWQKVRQVIKR